MLTYDYGKGHLKNWLISEVGFDSRYLGKYEAIMSLGNGYLGIRSATEERYSNEKRNMFVAGTFNRFDEREVSELPNCADVTAISLLVNGIPLDLNKAAPREYTRILNLKTAELSRRFIWGTEETGFIEFESKRFVSLSDLHLIGQKIRIRAVSDDVTLVFTSGIDGQQTNSGVQHFSDGDKRAYDKKCLQLVQTTTGSRIDFVINLVHNIYKNGEELSDIGKVFLDRRQISVEYEARLNKDEELIVEKFATVHTSRDREWLSNEYSLDRLRKRSCTELIEKAKRGYDTLFSESADKWEQNVWNKANIEIKSKNDIDQLAIRFSQYHLTAMTPAHDNRMNIAAKGLTGEGYKGHTFWDTEIFMLPYFIWHFPVVARSLLEYRYLSLPGAHKKARENGYEGAMFPWESAWLDEGETTPEWGGVDIITGKPIRIWSGILEQHITSDIAFGVWNYFCITNDQDFMDRYGYELIMDAAKFWASRLEWDEKRQKYCINNVIGPDEYKEHVNNNAYTNYMAHWTLKLAMDSCKELKDKNPDLFEKLDRKLGLQEANRLWKERINLIYLPSPNAADVIPQDDTYLDKKNVDLTPFKNQKHVGSIFSRYNLDQINDIQVTKQADVLLLLYLLEDKFNRRTKEACWDYYEPRTLHDSSLSLSTHSILASDLGYKDLAYRLFRMACDIDLGPNMKSSDHGIHAASLGGIWQCVACGFGGLRMLNGRLRIDPHLPDQWESLKFTVMWHNDRLRIEITRHNIEIINETRTNKEIALEVRNENHILRDKLSLAL
ncbi:MAG TPA: glycoside hydrolase family 65 protein [Clostridiaceae bacterium]|nr:glycoside hydrolase family 65 protein [Clostridiaceae bacterium]